MGVGEGKITCVSQMWLNILVIVTIQQIFNTVESIKPVTNNSVLNEIKNETDKKI